MIIINNNNNIYYIYDNVDYFPWQNNQPVLPQDISPTVPIVTNAFSSLIESPADTSFNTYNPTHPYSCSRWQWENEQLQATFLKYFLPLTPMYALSTFYNNNVRDCTAEFPLYTRQTYVYTYYIITKNRNTNCAHDEYL